jgi:hypothetical protein
MISESSMRNKVLSVLLLREENTIRGGGDLKSKELTKRTQIRHQKFLTETLLHKSNVLRIITCDNHHQHKEEEGCDHEKCGQKEQNCGH